MTRKSGSERSSRRAAKRAKAALEAAEPIEIGGMRRADEAVGGLHAGRTQRHAGNGQAQRLGSFLQEPCDVGGGNVSGTLYLSFLALIFGKKEGGVC